MKLIFPVLFGLEKPLLFELQSLGYEKKQLRAEDGQITLDLGEAPAEFGPDEAKSELAYHIARCNINVSMAERCQLELFTFPARDFDALFDGSSALPWEKYIPYGAAFSVNGFSRKSKLFAVPSIQRLLKKSIVKRLLLAANQPEHAQLPESTEVANIELKFSLVDDELSLRIETSGTGLHKRGYRPVANEAPIKETLASGLLDIMRWRSNGQEALFDLFCGSGTIAIEAAMKAAGIAPALNRRFAFEDWPYLPDSGVSRARSEAAEKAEKADKPKRPFIFASDISAETVSLAEDNARRAGVSDWIEFSVHDALEVEVSDLPRLCGLAHVLLLSNPPYGERMSDEAEVLALEEGIGEKWLDRGELPKGVRWGVITADDYFEQACGYRSDKRRKLYNGMIKCYLYQYFKPGKRFRLY